MKYNYYNTKFAMHPLHSDWLNEDLYIGIQKCYVFEYLTMNK